MVVFNASTLILLAKAGLVEGFLQASRLEAIVPREVAREACEGRRSVDALIIQGLIEEKRITVQTLRERSLFEKMRRELGLGAGEAEAIALAVAKKAALVATDDRCAINACKLVRVPFATALNILVRMHEKSHLDRQQALFKLDILEREGRYKRSMLLMARSQLEAR